MGSGFESLAPHQLDLAIHPPARDREYKEHTGGTEVGPTASDGLPQAPGGIPGPRQAADEESTALRRLAARGDVGLTAAVSFASGALAPI
jgi:hypothetical protein